MAYTIPRYVAAAAIDDPALRFKWDDWRASEDFEYQSDKIVEKLAGVSPRAKIAAGIGMYEWIIGRFRSVTDDPTPVHLAEAAWCANVRPDYMEYLELDRREWLGPIRGPLWCAATWLVPMLSYKDEGEEELESGLAYLPRLAMHVLPKPTVFQDWLDKCMERLVALYPVPTQDPFEDLFEEEDRGGPLVPREVLDPDFDYKPERANELISKYLQGVDYRQNPLLRSPQEMIQEGFQGTPYTH